MHILLTNLSHNSGHYAFRNTEYGSYFIQSLASVLNEYCYNNVNMDLMTLLTFVNLQVAYGFESNAPDKSDYHKKKQIPVNLTIIAINDYKCDLATVNIK